MKLEAVNDSLSIVPGQLHAGANSTAEAAVDPRTARYELQPRVGERSEAIFVRHGDVIQFPRSSASLTCKWTTPEIQVNSSAVDIVGAADAIDVNNVEETPEDETEDEDVDNTFTAVSATQTKSQRPEATPVPQLSHQRSVVVQETPTAARVMEPVTFVDTLKSGKERPETVENTSSSETPDILAEDATAEAFSTAHTGESQPKTSGEAEEATSPRSIDGAEVEASVKDLPSLVHSASDDEQNSKRSPQVRVSKMKTRKRATPAIDGQASEEEKETVGRQSKRARPATSDQDGAQDGRIEADQASEKESSRLTKGKKKVLDAPEAKQTSSARSQRSSQPSDIVLTDPYQGPSPRVALSNSGITKSSQAVRFLKKQGGALVESTSDPFNILW